MKKKYKKKGIEPMKNKHYRHACVTLEFFPQKNSTAPTLPLTIRYEFPRTQGK